MTLKIMTSNAVHAALEKAGWRDTEDGYRKFNDAGELFSPHVADHERAFPAALEAAEKAVAADEVEDHGDDMRAPGLAFNAFVDCYFEVAAAMLRVVADGANGAAYPSPRDLDAAARAAWETDPTQNAAEAGKKFAEDAITAASKKPTMQQPLEGAGSKQDQQAQQQQ